MSELSHKYHAQIANIDDADKASQLFLSISSQFIHEYYMSFDEQFLNKGIFDFSEESLDNSPRFEWATEPVITSISNYSDAINKINGIRDNEITRREIRKENRGRIIGGGFGFGAAVKGMAAAGAINAVTGLAHSAVNAIGDSVSTFSAYSDKHDKLDEFKKDFVNSLVASIKRIFSIINEQLGTSINFDTKKAESIINNIKQGKLKGNVVYLALKTALLADPYNGEAYVLFAEKFPEIECDIINIAKFFHADLGDAYTILNFTFSNRMNAGIAKALLKGIDYQIDALTCEGFHENLYNFDTLVSKRCLVLTQLYINLFKQELIKPQDFNEEINEFTQYALHKYESLKEIIIKFCHDNGYQIGKLSLAENPSELAIYLAMNDFQKEVNYTYFGDIVPTKILRHYCTEINEKAKIAFSSQIYIFSCEVYDEDEEDDELMAVDEDKCFIFCDKGFGGRSSMFSHGFIPFDDINNVYYSKKLGSTYLKINNDISLGSSLATYSYWDRCAAVIRHVITTLTGKTLTDNFFNKGTKSNSDTNETNSSSNNSSGFMSSVKNASLSAFNKVTEVSTKATESILNKGNDEDSSKNSSFSSFTSSILSSSKSAFNKVTDVGSKASASLFTADKSTDNNSMKDAICPNCGAAIAKGKKFCGNCGTKIVVKPKTTCPNCGAEIAEGKKFCGMCGAKVLSPQKIICPSCGNEIEEGKKFCGNCGTKI